MKGRKATGTGVGRGREERRGEGRERKGGILAPTFENVPAPMILLYNYPYRGLSSVLDV
jgi:hypothetical protein